MRTITLSVTLILFFHYCYSQKGDFEGTITFKTFYESSDPSVTSEQLISYFGDSSIVYIKGNYYKYIYFNSTGISESTYDPINNRYYFKFHDNDTLFYIDNSKIPDEEYTVEIDDSSKIEILGYNCKTLKVFDKSSQMRYYYSQKIKLENADLSTHYLGGYYLFWMKTKSIYLMVEQITPTRKTKTIAVKIEKIKVKDSIFTIPYSVKKEI